MGDLRAVEHHFAGGFGVQAHQRFHQLRAPGAHQAVDAQHLAAVQREGNVIHRVAAAQPGQLVVDDFQHRLRRARIGLFFDGELCVADHALNDPVDLNVPDESRVDPATVTQNGHPVANAHDLFQTMGNVDDGYALRAQILDQLEEYLDLGVGERGGRLVHDEYAQFLLEHRLADLDDLLLADA